MQVVHGCITDMVVADGMFVSTEPDEESNLEERSPVGSGQ